MPSHDALSLTVPPSGQLICKGITCLLFELREISQQFSVSFDECNK